ncbi:MAG: transglutaminase-like domain-containing protein [Microgenomates group bacterium]
MERLINEQPYIYITLPAKKVLLFAELETGESLLFPSPKLKHCPEIQRNQIFSDRVNLIPNHYSNARNNPAHLLISVSTNFYRGKINVSDVSTSNIGLAKEALISALAETDDINSCDESIISVVEEIRSQTLPAFRYNPYVLTESILGWIRSNIKYSPYCKSAIEKLAKTVMSSPLKDRSNLYKLLHSSISIKDDILDNILKESAAQVQLPTSFKEASPEEAAQELMSQSAEYEDILSLLWWDKGAVSAKRTLEEKSGKCVNISNLAVALSRSLGIPSTTLSGYYKDSRQKGEHRWARSYIPPYGWVEFDPTNDNIPTDFEYDNYGYTLFYRTNDLIKPKLTVIEEGEYIPFKTRKELQEMLKRDKNLFEKIFRRDKHKDVIELLQNLPRYKAKSNPIV